jgi:hypothetical protein
VKTWERILRDLRERQPDFVCGAEWYANYTPTFSQRISLDIKPRGYVIESRTCKRHEHKGNVHEYRLVREPAPKQLQLAG